MDFIIKEITDSTEKSQICRNILELLPNWFGIPEAISEYSLNVQTMPFYVGVENGKIIGFIAIKIHNKFTLEVYVMGILEKYHCMGLGTQFIDICNIYGSKNSFEYLTVKTLADINPDKYYAKTRAFYFRMGFKPLEVFPELWDGINQCLFMVRPILK